MWKAISWVKEKSNIKIILALTALFIVFLVFMNGNIIGTAKLKSVTGGAGILDLEFGYSADRAYNILESQGTEGRQLYKVMLYVDFAFPFVYMMFGVLTIGYLLKINKIKNNAVHYLIFVPVLAMFCDWTENILILQMIGKFPAKMAVIALLSSTFTIMKFIFIAIFFAAIVVFFVRTIFSSKRKSINIKTRENIK